MFRKPTDMTSVYRTSYADMSRWVHETKLAPIEQEVASPIPQKVKPKETPVPKPAPQPITVIKPRKPSVVPLSILTKPTIKPSGIYHQGVLVKKINLYLTECGRNTLETGYCNGLSLLWLCKMSERQEGPQFYDRIKRIIDLPLSDLEIDIEKLLAQIEWGQHPEKRESCLHQQDAAVFLDGVKKKYGRGDNCSLQNLESELAVLAQPEIMINISGGKPSDALLHSIALFRRDDIYFLYDSNNLSGEATQHKNLAEVMREIPKHLHCESRLLLRIEAVEPPQQATSQSVSLGLGRG